MPIGVYERNSAHEAKRQASVSEANKIRHQKYRSEKIIQLFETKKLTCSKCKQERDVSEFQKDRHTITGFRTRCKSCASAYYAKKQREYNSANKEKLIQKRFWYYRKTAHGVTKEEYNSMLIAQGNACAICKMTATKPLCIDHNHKTNKLRGLLCHSCNSSLGLMKDSVTVLKNAAQYLEERGSYGET